MVAIMPAFLNDSLVPSESVSGTGRSGEESESLRRQFFRKVHAL